MRPTQRLTAVASKLSTVRMIDKLSLQLSVFGPLQGASGTRIANWTSLPRSLPSPPPVLVLVTFDGLALVIAANLKVAFVVNRKIANTAIGRDVASALAEFDVPVLPVALHQRVLYAESAAQGLAVFEVAPNSDAAREIVALVENINNQQRAAA